MYKKILNLNLISHFPDKFNFCYYIMTLKILVSQNVKTVIYIYYKNNFYTHL